MLEPGLDRHEWETQFQQLEDDLRTSPIETLPELYALVERMLKERGIAIDDFVADDGIEPELRAEMRAARDTTAQVNRDEEIDPGDIASATNGLTLVYEYVLSEFAAP